ncbi:MAG: ATP-binding cassette domain-containing protein [Slackia sp.]
MARTLLTLSHITYTYPPAAEAALRDVSATFDAGWTAVIGDNGCGKTTLARIACGLVRPDEGTVSARLPFVYCEQDPRIEPATLYDFACDFAPDAVRLRSTLEIPDDAPWRIRAHLAARAEKTPDSRGVVEQTELLVLDELTNHVDAACRERILALRGFLDRHPYFTTAR